MKKIYYLMVTMTILFLITACDSINPKASDDDLAFEVTGSEDFATFIFSEYGIEMFHIKLKTPRRDDDLVLEYYYNNGLIAEIMGPTRSVWLDDKEYFMVDSHSGMIINDADDVDSVDIVFLIWEPNARDKIPLGIFEIPSD